MFFRDCSSSSPHVVVVQSLKFQRLNNNNSGGFSSTTTISLFVPTTTTTNWSGGGGGVQEIPIPQEQALWAGLVFKALDMLVECYVKNNRVNTTTTSGTTTTTAAVLPPQIPSLTSLEVDFDVNGNGYFATTPILQQLAGHAALTSGLEVLRIHWHALNKEYPPQATPSTATSSANSETITTSTTSSSSLAASFPRLKELDLTYCGLESLRALACPPQDAVATTGDIFTNSLTTLLPLGLRTLRLGRCRYLRSLDGLGDHPYDGLETLDLQGTPIRCLAPLAAFSGPSNSGGGGGCRFLRNLNVFQCSLASLQGIGKESDDNDGNETGLPFLEVLNASTTSITSVRPLAHCRALRTLDVSGCSHLDSLDGLQNLTQLQVIDLSSCPNITSLRELSGGGGTRKGVGCLSLKKVTLYGNHHISSLDGLLDNLTTLEALDASFTTIASLCDHHPSHDAPVFGGAALKNLSIIGCNQLTSFDGLERFVKTLEPPTVTLSHPLPRCMQSFSLPTAAAAFPSGRSTCDGASSSASTHGPQ